ncbi:MAG: class I adenylate-forming enzyme family protein [Acidobacteriota bacterium]
MFERACPLARRFLRLAARAEEQAALLDPSGETISTRAALARQAIALAAQLTVRVAPGAVVVLSAPNSPALVRMFLALRLCQARVALVDAGAPPVELEQCAETVGARAICCDPERAAPGALLLGDGELPLSGRAAGAPPPFPPETAVFKLTSGSTGRPRAIAVSARQLAADTVQIMRTMGVTPGDVTLAAAPLTHSYGLGSGLVPLLLTGTPLVCLSSSLPASLAGALAAARVAHFPAVPAMIRALATLPGLPELPHLRVCLAAGAPLSPRDAAAFHAATGHKVHVFYGASECGGITYDRGASPCHREGEVGTAMERVTVEVAGETGAPLPAGNSGRVRVRSRAVALATVPPPEEPGTLGNGVFLTGDLGVLDERGGLTLTGRVAELLNVAGKKVHPEEVRRALAAIPGVRDVAVAGLPDERRGDLVAALVALEPGSNLTVGLLLAACRASLASYKVPRRIALVDELPTSDRGKLRKDVVTELLARPPGGRGAR